MSKTGLFDHIKQDIPASIVVFLVALPLCLGIALASGVPLLSGLVAGIVGGVVVGALSGSRLGVSGPAAGLVAIVLPATKELGLQPFFTAVVIAGVLQLAIGYARAGIIAYYFPTSVIKGMLAAIGIIIFFKQIPHAFGVDADFEGDLAFAQRDGETTISEILHLGSKLRHGAIIIAAVALSILILWETKLFKSFKFTKLIQGPLVAVVASIGLVYVLEGIPSLALPEKELVNIPKIIGGTAAADFKSIDFSAFLNGRVWLYGAIIALVASIETLLCVEATDKLDPQRQITPTNRELKAQGVGNILSGLLGGLPVTQVIVRSSANIQSGGKSKLSAIIHGFLLIITVLLIPGVLNRIPLAGLAAVLMLVGYKLAKPSLFRTMYKAGWEQFVPFVVTVAAIFFTDLLVGIAIGFGVAVIVILYHNFRIQFTIPNENRNPDEPIRIVFGEHMTFLNKASVMDTLSHIPEDTHVILDLTKTVEVDHDIEEVFQDFAQNAAHRGISLQILRDENTNANLFTAGKFKQVIKERQGTLSERQSGHKGRDSEIKSAV